MGSSTRLLVLKIWLSIFVYLDLGRYILGMMIEEYLPIEKTAVEIKTVGFEWETECTLHTPEKCRGEPRLPYYYTAAVFSVHFNESIYFNDPKAMRGGTRMICGNRLIESFQPVSKKGNIHNPIFDLENPPTNLNVLERRPAGSPTTLKSLFQAVTNKNNSYEAFLLLNYSIKDGYYHHVMSN